MLNNNPGRGHDVDVGEETICRMMRSTPTNRLLRMMDMIQSGFARILGNTRYEDFVVPSSILVTPRTKREPSSYTPRTKRPNADLDWPLVD